MWVPLPWVVRTGQVAGSNQEALCAPWSCYWHPVPRLVRSHGPPQGSGCRGEATRLRLPGHYLCWGTDVPGPHLALEMDLQASHGPIACAAGSLSPRQSPGELHPEPIWIRQERGHQSLWTRWCLCISSFLSGRPCAVAWSASERPLCGLGGAGLGSLFPCTCPSQPRSPTVLCPLKARPQPLEMHMRYWLGWAICTAFQGGH